MNLKTIVCTAGGIILNLFCSFDRFIPVIICVLVFSAMDFVTGIIKAKLHYEICSKRAFEGLWKKFALISALFFGILLDYALPALVSGSEYAQLADQVVFSSFIGFYIVVGEAISITENLHECSVPLPSFVTKFLKICKEKIESKGENKK